MSFNKMYAFLRELDNNNSKKWMDKNRSRYEDIRDWYIEWLDDIDNLLSNNFKEYVPTSGSKAISRINNNLKFHPERPTYKSHFGGDLDQGKNNAEFQIHIGTDINFVGGGFYSPSSDVLKKIRKAIDTNGAEFEAILNKDSFKMMFGGLEDVNPLKTSPRNYNNDNEHIDLLNHTSFVVFHKFTQKQVQEDNFPNRIVEMYAELLPFRNFLKRALV